MVTADQNKQLEQLQRLAFNIVYGRTKSYGQKMEDLDGKLDMIGVRRQKLVDKCFPRWSIVSHDLRRSVYYREEFAKTERLYNSPIATTDDDLMK